MGTFGDAYRKTLKPRETEEFPNSWLFRPTAFLIVYAVKDIGFITPNLITCFSMISGILSSVFLAAGMPVAAFFAMLLMVLLDCADGQLARLTGKSSKTGKILDVCADAVSYFSVFTGSALYMYNTGGNSNVFWLIPISFISIVLNVVFYDQFKSQYIRYVYSDYHDKMEQPVQLRQQARDAKGILKRIGLYGYYVFYMLETGLVYAGSVLDLKKHKKIFGLGREISSQESAAFKKHFFLMIRLWSLLGSGTHFLILLAILIVADIKFLLPVFIIYSLAILILLLIIQNFVFLSYRQK
ncbi:MAG: CDP-alcohol phosphatidyltransferase family protein [Spirochaetales bacterium]|nr:CDP-alcohol phosphatidyltransferase family protein [Spirochaetales bacterium]